MASLGEGGASLGRGGLEKAWKGEAEGNVESQGFGAIWDRDGDKLEGMGAMCIGAGRRAWLGDVGLLLGQYTMR